MAALCRSSAACPGRSRLRVKRLVLSPAMGTGRQAGRHPSLRPLVRKRNWASFPRRRPSPLLPGPRAARRPRARSPEGRPRLVPPAEALRRGAAPAASLTALRADPAALWGPAAAPWAQPAARVPQRVGQPGATRCEAPGAEPSSCGGEESPPVSPPVSVRAGGVWAAAMGARALGIVQSFPWHGTPLPSLTHAYG